MAKKSKKRTKGTKHFFFKTRLGFYSLVIVLSILMINTIHIIQDSDMNQAVLGRDDNRSSEKSEKQEREDKEEDEEEKGREVKEEIRSNFRVEPEGLRVKFENTNGKVSRSLESDQEEIELDEDTEEELEDTIEDSFEDENEIDIASEGGDLTVEKHKVKVRTGFPLSIDVSTNQLIVTRPDGSTKIVTILPDKAVQNFLRHKKIAFVGGDEDAEDDIDDDTGGSGSDSADTNPPIATDEGSIVEETEAEVELVEHNGLVAYEVKAKKKIKLLGLIPTTVDTTGYVSADTGDVVDEKTSFFTKLLEFFSF